MSSRTSVPKLQASEPGLTNEADRKKIIAAAYDAIAVAYDSQLAPARWIRERLWERMDILFPPKSRILDVTAGTGLDILHLIERDVSVVACDISPKMLDILHKRHPEIETIVCDFNQLEVTGEFDGIISTFAGLNTSAHLGTFAEQAARLLHPGGTLLIHLLNRWPFSRLTRQFARFRWRDLWHTLKMNPQSVHVGNVLVPHYLYSPNLLYRSAFADKFLLSRIEGQGFLRPLDVEWGSLLEGLERRLASRFPFYALGVFFSLELTRAQ